MVVLTYTYESLLAAEKSALPAADELTAAFVQIGASSTEEEGLSTSTGTYAYQVRTYGQRRGRKNGGMTNVLTLVEHHVPRITWSRRWLFFWRAGEAVEVHLDFVIDGKPLRTWIQE